MHKSYQVTTYLSNQKHVVQIRLYSKEPRHVHCLHLQNAQHVYQATTLNEFINESVYTVICHLTCDPISYHLYGVSPSFIRTTSGQLLIGFAGVHLCIDHIIGRSSHLDNNE